MTVKEYLMQIKNLNDFINSKCREKEQLHSDLMTMTLQSVKLGDKIKSSVSVDSMQRTIEKIDDMEKEIDKEIDNLVDLKYEVRQNINKLPDNRFKTVLIDYYINGLTFNQISDNMSYCKRHIERIYGNALDELRNLLKLE